MNKANLSQTDLDVLGYYADTQNRELYWNYLAQLPGNDGYGGLALGVVRNDNMPGATANAYAAAYARKHNERSLTEREWDDFGVDLVKRDLAARKRHMDKGEADLALNLPTRDVQEAHDKAFDRVHIDPNAWTPRKLLESARTRGEDEAEQLWSSMLNNGAMGIHRGADTLHQIAVNEDMPFVERMAYANDMRSAYTHAINHRSNDNPNIIGTTEHYYMRDRHGDWSEMYQTTPTIGVQHNDMRDVTDAALRNQLEDTHNLRIERGEARRAFHPDDPGQLIRSPHPFAEAPPRSSLPRAGDDPLYAAIRKQLPFDVSNDKVAEVALQARQTGMRHAHQLENVAIHGSQIICEGSHPAHGAQVARDTPAPPMEQSLAQAQQMDQQAMQAQAERQQMAMQHSGPVMRM
jgi:hypothetical protein